MRILIAEDDSILADGLSARSGTMATRSTRCATALRPIPRWPPRPSICSSLDLGLPHLAAWKCCGACARAIPPARPDPDRRRQHRAARQGLDLGADDMAKPFALSEEACARADPPGRRRRHAAQAWPPGVRPDRPRGDGRRADAGPVRARGQPAGNPAHAQRPHGQQDPAGRSPVRMGRGSQHQRDRGLCAPPAETRAQRRES